MGADAIGLSCMIFRLLRRILRYYCFAFTFSDLRRPKRPAYYFCCDFFCLFMHRCRVESFRAPQISFADSFQW